jgi:hypothetical protein
MLYPYLVVSDFIVFDDLWHTFGLQIWVFGEFEVEAILPGSFVHLGLSLVCPFSFFAMGFGMHEVATFRLLFGGFEPQLIVPSLLLSLPIQEERLRIQ